MRDTVPSLTKQGLNVRFIESPDHTYNSALFRHGRDWKIASRRYNPDTHRFEITIYDFGRWSLIQGSRDHPPKTLKLPSSLLRGHAVYMEDPRVFTHAKRLHLAYSEVHVDRSGVVQMSAQRLVRLDDKLEVDLVYPLAYARNGAAGQQKNWQFFSHDGAIHFVYSINPHLVVRLTYDGMDVAEEFRTEPKLSWPFGTMSGGTPPVLVDGRYVSFFHSYTRRPTRHRRYTMSAYEFSATAPFGITRITEPILRASAADPSRENPITAWWDPLVVFPSSAFLKDGVWTVTAGVNDSYDALIEIPHGSLQFKPVVDFAAPRVRAFVIDSVARRIRVSGNTHTMWVPFGSDAGGVRQGKLVTADANVTEVLAERPDVREVTLQTYEQLR